FVDHQADSVFADSRVKLFPSLLRALVLHGLVLIDWSGSRLPGVATVRIGNRLTRRRPRTSQVSPKLQQSIVMKIPTSLSVVRWAYKAFPPSRSSSQVQKEADH